MLHHIQNAAKEILTHPYRCYFRHVLLFDNYPKEVDHGFYDLFYYFARIGLKHELIAINQELVKLCEKVRQEQLSLYQQKKLTESLIKQIWQMLLDYGLNEEKNNQNEHAKHKSLKIRDAKILLNRICQAHQLSISIRKSQSNYFLSTAAFTVHEIESRKRIRRKKRGLKYLATGLSIVVAIGEGVVASIFVTALALFPALLIVGIPGFLVNYFLFKHACYDFLAQASLTEQAKNTRSYVSRLYIDSNGNEISKTKKRIINATLVFTIAAGVSSALVTFGSILSAFGPLFFGLTAAASVAAPPVGLALIAGSIAVLTGLVITALFYSAMADFVKNERHKQVGRYFKKTFYTDLIAKDVSLSKKLLNLTVNIITLSATIFLATVICLFTLGLFTDKSILVLSSTAKISSQVAGAISWGISGAAFVARSFFESDAIRGFFSLVKSFAIKSYQVLSSPIQSFKRLFGFVKSIPDDPIRKLETATTNTALTTLAGCTVVNAWAQSGGGMNALAVKTTRSVIPMPKNLAQLSTQAAGFTGSAGANGQACISTLQQPKRIATEKPVLFRFREKTKRVSKTNEKASLPHKPLRSSLCC